MKIWKLYLCHYDYNLLPVVVIDLALRDLRILQDVQADRRVVPVRHVIVTKRY